MNRSVTFSTLLCATLAFGSASLFAQAQPVVVDTSDDLTFEVWNDQALQPPSVDTWSPQTTVMPGLEVNEKRGGHPKPPPALAVPNYTNSITVGRTRYSYTQIGSDPSKKGAKNVTVPVMIVPVIAKFDDGSVFDPTQPQLCLKNQAPLPLLQQSPIFQTFAIGDGPRQYEEEFRRLEFWKYIGVKGGINPTYSVRLAPTVMKPVTVAFHGFNTQLGRCLNNVGVVDLETWDTMVQNSLLPAVQKLGVTSGTLPFFLLTNVYFFEGNKSNCCTLGYHNANVANNVIQTYGVGDFDSSRLFIGITDISVIAHEIAEWMDDPLGNNPTPPWGHIGQQPDCQNNLEVGDPLSGTTVQINMPNGFTYHPQELAFFSWFFDQKPSIGFDGWYSSAGTFKVPAAPCH